MGHVRGLSIHRGGWGKGEHQKRGEGTPQEAEEKQENVGSHHQMKKPYQGRRRRTKPGAPDGSHEMGKTTGFSKTDVPN